VVQLQCPFIKLHVPPLRQRHSLLQFTPKKPEGQAVTKPDKIHVAKVLVHDDTM